MRDQERVVDNMSKEEALRKLKQIIVSSNYDVEELLEVTPDDLLEDVLNMIKERSQQESEDISYDLRGRSGK